MEKVQNAAQLDLSDQTDEDLLGYMAMRDDDPRGADAAFKSFYERHVKYVFGVCRRAPLSVLYGSGVEDLVQQVFLSAYQSAGTYRGIDSPDPKQQQAWTRAWLNRIATNLIISALRNQRGMMLAQIDDTEPEAEEPANLFDCLDEKRLRMLHLINEALDTLNEKEKQVCEVKCQWYRADRHNQRLPNQVALKLGMTSESLRQTWLRAKRKVKEYVEARL
jgi:RNA polymerase sigma factor (sigma-70 family)